MPVPTTCPSCGADAAGRYCANCGTVLAGASCANCAAALTPGAHFCHRCGTPAGATVTPAARGIGGVLPWAVAALALASLIALVVGQRFGARPNPANDVADGSNGQAAAPFTNPADAGAPPAGMPRAPDISQLTPAQRAERLYDRIMTEHEAGRSDAVRTFMPMAVAAYEMLAPLSLDQRYDLGRLGEVGGDAALARAQSDTILRERPTHLLGLILGANAARMSGDEPHARQFEARLLSVEPRERQAGLPEYRLHKNDIESALTAARARK
ncbi:MAG: Double zinc ribbon [Gemmatimonadetes bacterium]|jgi:hypothetical protein|nr:Double zinc ribbon [Gemmatimonadota bacterium]